jgi:hypothetical protein
MSRIRMTLAITGALALAPAFALAGGDGTGQGAGGAKSKVVIKNLKATGASGKVSSQDNKCAGDRRVQFFRLDDFISVKIQKTRTNGGGNWHTKKDLKPGTYFAKVDSVPGCRYDVSKYETLR